MASKRMLLFFDRKLKHSKSASTIAQQYIEVADQHPALDHEQRHKQAQLYVPDRTTPEFTFGRMSLQPPKSKAPSWPQSSPSQTRVKRTPTIGPPDELFLRTVRRRSALARLEEMRIEKQYRGDRDMAMRLAFASALPPSYLDSPPGYQAMDNDEPEYIRGRPPLTDTCPFQQEFDFDANEHLKLQIDETIAQFSSVKVTVPTPTVSPPDFTLIVSPLNEIDQMYLERRRIRQRRDR